MTIVPTASFVILNNYLIIYPISWLLLENSLLVFNYIISLIILLGFLIVH